MKLLDTDLTYVVPKGNHAGDQEGGQNRVEKCHIRLYRHAWKMVAVISDIPKRNVEQIFDDATSLFEGITRQFEIPVEQCIQVLHFAEVPEAQVPERFSLFFPGVSVGTGAPGSVQLVGKMLAIDLVHLQSMIGEKW